MDQHDVLREVVRGTATDAGEGFFRELVRHLATALGVRGAWVTELVGDRRLRAFAFWLDGRFVEDFEYDVTGTPCEPVVRDRRLVHVPDRVLELYPRDPDLRPAGAVSYLGLPLLDVGGEVLGHLAVLDSRPMAADERFTDLFRIFANRAAVELRRLRAAGDADALRREAEELRRELGRFDRVLGSSRALLDVLRAVDQVAPTNATVLLQGETGTGKELIAAAIHEASARRGKPWVKVNCAAIPATLVESELFGHERGAFTGATQRREGRFALADRGTIFLDEVGELAPDVQAKLLRVLQEGEFEPVGASRTRRVDVRVVAATNRDLAAEVARGAFREDLFYRLNVFPIRIPPLRERGEDVVLLADAFVRKFARELGREIAPLDEAAKLRLRAYPWPGNVRELRNVMERAVIVARAGRLDLEGMFPATTPTVAAPAERVLTDAELRALERANLERALAACGGKVAGPGGAARLLGMRPSTLTSRLKALGVTRSRES